MPKKKINKTQSAKPEAIPQPPAPQTIVRTQPPPTVVSLLDLAQQEEPRRELSEFSHVINVLRDEKNFTFREIAQWIHSHTGFQADHNAVYREYTKGMPDDVATAEGLADEATEMEERGC